MIVRIAKYNNWGLWYLLSISC